MYAMFCILFLSIKYNTPQCWNYFIIGVIFGFLNLFHYLCRGVGKTILSAD